jgi:hypothetical protein
MSGSWSDRARRRWSRATSSTQDLASDELRDAVGAAGAVLVSDARCGDVVALIGVLSSVTTHPPGSAHGMDAELFDGSGRVRLVWLGRTRIPGIEPGRRIRVEGRLVNGRLLPRLYNPRYTLLVGPSA